MSQTPARPTREDAAVSTIMEIIERPRPIIQYGLPDVPRRGGRKPSDEVSAALSMLRRGEPGMTMDYPDPYAARRAACVLASYRSANGTPIRICKRDCRVYVWPSKAPTKR